MHGHDGFPYLLERYGCNGGQCRTVYVHWVGGLEGKVASIPIGMGRCWRAWSLSGGVQEGVEQEVHDQEVKGGGVEHDVHGM